MDNKITYVATPINRLDNGTSFGQAMRVYVNGDWKFSVNVVDKWDGMCLVIMFTRVIENHHQAASFHIVPTLVHENLSELAQVYAPF
jgi:hypothetical protein